MKTVLFLGAGASKFAGMPTTKDLIANVLQRVLHQETWISSTAASLARNAVRDHSEEDVEVLYETIRKMIDAEELHRKAMGYKMAGDNHPAWKREILTISAHNSDKQAKESETNDIDENIATLKSLRVVIRNTLLASLTVKRERIGAVVELYDELFKNVQPDYIVTTNYDNVLETYCEETGKDLANGFKKSHLGNVRMWDGEWKGRGEINLTKIHGSITWQEDDDGLVLEIGRPGLREVGKDVMIVPTLGEKDYSHGIFPDLQTRFKSLLAETDLAETDLLIVVGFSFRDTGINKIFRRRLTRSVGNPRPMRLLYVGPKEDDDDMLKKFVGGKDEPRKVRGDHCVLWYYSRGDMPYVYAYRRNFEQYAAEQMKGVLDDLDAACRATPAD